VRTSVLPVPLLLVALGGALPAVAGAPPSAPAPTASAIVSPSLVAAGDVPDLAWSVVSRRPHDPAAFTQGLQLDESGRLFESTGLYGQSTLRQLDPASGSVLRSVALPDRLFAEGLAVVDDRLVQLTWREGRARVWDADSFDLLDTFRYEGEGWGLCNDGERLVMSDGSDTLTFRSPSTFEVDGRVRVDGHGFDSLPINELECVDGVVWANLWQTDSIVRIDPASGAITGRLDLAPLHEEVLDVPVANGTEPPDVLNGIAWDEASGTFLVTGKRWPTMFEIHLDDPG
jgi:glutaminyl-peptide cyclotransferase